MTLTKISVPICPYSLKCTKFGQMILRKIIKMKPHRSENGVDTDPYTKFRLTQANHLAPCSVNVPFRFQDFRLAYVASFGNQIAPKMEGVKIFFWCMGRYRPHSHHRNHRGGVKLPPGVSPFLGQVRKKLQRLHPCIGGKTFLRGKPLCSGSRSVPEVVIAEAETGNYNICGHRRATLEIPMSISTLLSISCSMATKSK